MDKEKIDEIINLSYALTGQAQAYQVNKATLEGISEQREKLLHLIIVCEKQAESRGHSQGYLSGLRAAVGVVKEQIVPEDNLWPSAELGSQEEFFGFIIEKLEALIKEGK